MGTEDSVQRISFVAAVLVGRVPMAILRYLATLPVYDFCFVIGFPGRLNGLSPKASRT